MVMDKHKVAEALSDNLLNLPWIDEITSHEGFPEGDVFYKQDGTMECNWYMGEKDDDTFIDIEVNMEHSKEAQQWYSNLPLRMDEDDENGNTLWMSYDESEDCAEMRNDDVTEEGYEYPPDHIEICVRSQTHLRQLAEACITNNERLT